MSKEESEVRGLGKLLARLAKWRMFIIPAMLVGSLIAAVALWRNFGSSLVSSRPETYQVALEKIHLNEAPPWIRTDIRNEVFHDAGWHEQPLSILDPDLTVRVAQAFEQHTWVEGVTRVEKRSPAALDIELKYRRPVAMVEVDYQGSGGLLPVDTGGVLLPPDDFTPEQAVTFPRITVDYPGPSGSIGTSWGDDRVVGAAAIASALIDYWSDLGFYRIVAIVDSGSSNSAAATYELQTRNGQRLTWGRAPGREMAGETPSDQKIVKLLRYLQQHGLPDEDSDFSELNLVGEVSLSQGALNPAR